MLTKLQVREYRAFERDLQEVIPMGLTDAALQPLQQRAQLILDDLSLDLEDGVDLNTALDDAYDRLAGLIDARLVA